VQKDRLFLYYEGLEAKLASIVKSELDVAITAIYWSIFLGLEWYLGVFATFCACYREHLATITIATTTASIAIRFPCLATRWASLGFVSVAFRCEELLFFSTKSEGDATIGAL